MISTSARPTSRPVTDLHWTCTFDCQRVLLVCSSLHCQFLTSLQDCRTRGAIEDLQWGLPLLEEL